MRGSDRELPGDEASRQQLVELVRGAGLRVTAPRLAVLASLAHRPHSDTDSVIRHVRAQLGSVSPQAVYNVLAAFVEAGVVRRIEPAGSVPLYELRVADNHHHVVCRGCGAVGDVDCAVGRRPCLTPSDTHGYLLDEAEVTYWGWCPDCQAAATTDTDTDTDIDTHTHTGTHTHTHTHTHTDTDTGIVRKRRNQ